MSNLTLPNSGLVRSPTPAQSSNSSRNYNFVSSGQSQYTTNRYVMLMPQQSLDPSTSGPQNLISASNPNYQQIALPSPSATPAKLSQCSTPQVTQAADNEHTQPFLLASQRSN